MESLLKTSSLRKSYSNEPKRTLSFLEVDDDDGVDKQSSYSESETSYSNSNTLIDKNKSKTEKSVHFADEDSILNDAHSLTSDSTQTESRSRDTSDCDDDDVISWLPSEHLYSDDTFIPDTDTNTNRKTSHASSDDDDLDESYGTNTFIQLRSGEETDSNTDSNPDTNTEHGVDSEYSYSDSFVSTSDVVSGVVSQDTHLRDWRDGTEIVKDIEELEESEFVTRVDSLELGEQEGDDTEASESFDEEVTQEASRQFVFEAIRQLHMRSTLNLDLDSTSSTEPVNCIGYPPPEPSTKEENQFCRKMIKRLNHNNEHSSKPKPSNSKKQKQSTGEEEKEVHSLYSEVRALKDMNSDLPVEFYGLSSALIDRLRLGNLQQSLANKSQELDKQIKSSERYVTHSKDVETLSKQRFVQQSCGHVRRENMDEAIQAHLIRMHPVTQFAEFVKALPKAGEDLREVVYRYKTQLQHRNGDN